MYKDCWWFKLSALTGVGVLTQRRIALNEPLKSMYQPAIKMLIMIGESEAFLHTSIEET